MHKTLVLALGLTAAAPALAAGIEVDIELPRIDVADFRRPYVAVWLERPDNTVAANLAVWYGIKMRDGEGTKWLKDLRQWWRRSGRELAVPVDGVTSATRAPGTHRLSFTAGEAPLGKLAAGEYRLVVEASREHGGREVLNVPLTWPPAAATSAKVQGKHELGTVAVQLVP
ncbi:DUF2271 domain-containing protein [Pseudothauera rhizosphaerae]|uniref:DUF2271 domain-containing protein n=1 Tax=Pseudothauera rhizosphaerae TaxID=2565932 RepID=A0A4S4AD04_9RHOO|nr:DUF2271 domain-containing protein [Pseudothauera rhizosphaerae]THF56869.1 DUF2271 domain-containing protein [Pseudothauera rhizosphaerae]